MATPVDPVASALERWRNNLIDLTRRNPLLNLKAGRSSYLEIALPDLTTVYTHLVTQGKTWSFCFPPEKALKEGETLTTEPDRQGLLRTLTNLYRRAATDYRERGIHTLHLGLGVLEWRDEAEETYRSPLLLLPV